VVIQRLVGHELVHQQPLRASVRLRGAVADELDEVPVLDDAQEMDLGEPLLVALVTASIKNGVEMSSLRSRERGCRTAGGHEVRNIPDVR
jgi:hypothetical protein